MILVECEAKALLKARGLPIPDGMTADTPDEARRAAEALRGAVVLKVQIPMGGRMKAGGVRFAATPDEAEAAARDLLGRTLLGWRVERLLIERRLTIAGEYYLGATYDSGQRTTLLLASAAGGIDIETNVSEEPHSQPPIGTQGDVGTRHVSSVKEAGVRSLTSTPFSTVRPFPDYVGRIAASALGLRGKALNEAGALAKAIGEAFVASDALLLECNPLALDDAGRWWIADVHLEIDDDALYRQKALLMAAPFSAKLAARRDAFEASAAALDERDHRGAAGRLVALGGSIGLIMGGGGASLTTMDALLDAGLAPANYSEIGGNPSVWKVKELTKLILSQPQVERLLVIMNVVSNTRVDLMARGVIKGILELGREPCEVIAGFRIPGSWEDEGAKLLDHYGVRHFGRETTIEGVIEHIL
jgi:succinyl-CoA synthetase beta subunit/citryl-CoA synthetase large subunit